MVLIGRRREITLSKAALLVQSRSSLGGGGVSLVVAAAQRGRHVGESGFFKAGFAFITKADVKNVKQGSGCSVVTEFS